VIGKKAKLAALSLAASGLCLGGWQWTLDPADAAATANTQSAASQIVGMRRLTEAQYRNSISDIFGPDIRVAGRFEPIVRPAHELIASGARESAISPSGLEQFDAIGRSIAAQVFDEMRRGQFLPCSPVNATAADPACARTALKPLGRLLFRRPLTQSELEHYVTLAGKGAGPSGSFHKGLELALGAMLVSPKYLYILENAEPDIDHPGALRLDSFSRAARLSFMLWNSTPNEYLLRAAELGQLTDPVALSAIANKMVNSPRFEQGVRAFFTDMLLFEKFDELAKDPVIYPYFNQDVLQALPEQTLRTITGHLLDDEGSYQALFTTPKTVMTRSLAALYQVPVRRSSGWESFSFSAQDDRAGLLGQAGFLALYSHSGRSSPTLRGRAIREVLMCQPVPNPPGNVNFTAVQDVTNQAVPTARIRLNAHNTDPVCAGCHKITDPAGLSLEKFDGIGAVRKKENGAEIDVSGMMDGTPFVGGTGLGNALAASPDTTMCVTSRALEYSAGKPVEDEAELESVQQRFAASGYTIRALFRTIAGSPDSYRVAPASTHIATLNKEKRHGL
jgi:Protein of unknown function (DUF1588)/Protein of unknown function (DUF1592)/Protein of unknown function (DUF1595)/Protein of unknown function (DUF1585)/Protein of unknown function (DUF1587)